ncbi:TlpA family protein disulfide reductase [Pseudalkalibacillus caeni]|uniref:TlpA family protein disulfide reductase n=1 Tax=Exobacillus caeni TaxID=2574798 RepID=A0A5R9FBA9_9BACL|nr:TlpA disulfide reductase family protein [Pseudalkalibacillus caeni]TLS38958.1 TlpA family protein disulfide reductase [Pseudalkalibacillus caeni]
MRVGERMPELIGESAWLNGRIDKRYLLGKPSIIHFWSVSCGSCKRSMEQFNQLRDRYADQLEIVSVHMPRSDKDLDIDLVKKTVRDLGMTQSVLIDNDHAVTDEFRNRNVPSYYLFDHEGKLYHVQSGDRGMRLLERKIERLL